MFFFLFYFLKKEQKKRKAASLESDTSERHRLQGMQTVLTYAPKKSSLKRETFQHFSTQSGAKHFNGTHNFPLDLT